jgi:hypothetical protein
LAWRDIVNGPGKVILVVRSVLARRNSTSRTSTGRSRRIRARDARHDDGAAGASAHGRRVVEIDPREGGRKAVRVALAADLAVGDDVDAGALHVADRKARRIVLRLFEPGFR